MTTNQITRRLETICGKLEALQHAFGACESKMDSRSRQRVEDDFTAAKSRLLDALSNLENA